jgi:hypothetical protein
MAKIVAICSAMTVGTVLVAYLGAAFVMADLAWMRDLWEWTPPARAVLLSTLPAYCLPAYIFVALKHL